MNGIEILNQYEVVASYTWSWSTFWCWFFPLFTIVFLFCVAIGCAEHTPAAGAIAGGILGLIVGIILGCIFASSTPDTYTPVYQVIISEDISMTEFYDKYEIIKQEGKIFTIKEKLEN